MKVFNPSDKDISIQFRGVAYSVEAQSSLENVPTEAADYWKNMLHNFIEISTETEAPAEVEEAPKEEEPKEEIKEEVEEKPAKVAKKKKGIFSGKKK